MLQQLSTPPRVFVNREPLLESITAEFEAARAAGRPALVAVHGAPGVGARSLVRKWYWSDPARFPDGATPVRLGDAVHGDPQAIGDALGAVLIDLGFPASELPASADDRHKRLLNKTFGLSVLLVLEEVSSAAQVEPFLLNSPQSAVIVISRSPIRRLSQLGFRQIPVGPLAPEHGMELFEQVLGPRWWSADDIRPETVVAACGGYPLAMTTTAAQIATTPDWEVTDFVRSLSRRGLDALDAESQDYVRDSFERAYDRLSPVIARAYRLVIGLHPGKSVSVESAATLLDCAPDEARAHLAALVSAHLLSQAGPDLFHFHDVAHWHARDCAERDEPAGRRAEAAARIVTRFLDLTVRHDRVLSGRPRVGERYARPDSEVPSRAQALTWLEDNRLALRDAVLLAERHRLDDEAWQLCEALWGLYHLHGHFDDWITTHRAGVAAAEESGNPIASIRMCSQLGTALLNNGDLTESEKMFSEALRLSCTEGDGAGRQSALEWLGKIEAQRGNVPQARLRYAESWAVAETEAPVALRPRMFALLRLNQARASLVAKEFDVAVREVTAAIDHFADTAESDNQAKSLIVRAQALAALDNPADATRDAHHAATLFHTDGSLRGESSALEILRTVDPDPDARDQHARRLREIYTTVSDPRATTS